MKKICCKMKKMLLISFALVMLMGVALFSKPVQVQASGRPVKIQSCLISGDQVVCELKASYVPGAEDGLYYIYSDEVIEDVDSYDEASAYPYVMVTRRFPMSQFKVCDVKKREELLDDFAYLIRVQLNKARCKYYNNFISGSKCEEIRGGRFDNGRIINAEKIIITVTDVDFKFILDTYDCNSYEILECYYVNFHSDNDHTELRS